MIEEDSDLTIKRLEELYSLTIRVLRRQVDRFDAIEAKAWRHFALLAFILGTLTIGIPTFVRVLGAASGWWAIGFGAAYGGMLLASAVALGAFTVALRYQAVKDEPLSEETIQDFLNRRYLDELLSLAKGAVDAHGVNKRILASKLCWAKAGYGATVVALSLGVIVVVLFLGIELQSVDLILQ